jgi:ParB-like chromosome segregation protein Spo0J
MELKAPKIVLRDIETIQPYELNSKIHDKSQVKGIAKSIKEFGWDQPIVVDVDGVIIKGHGRRLAAIELGLKKVPVLVRDDLTPDQVRAARLADNRVAISGIDNTLLRKELESLDFDLEGIFDKKELDFLTADLAQIDDTAFVEDLNEAVAQQAQETAAKVAAIDDKQVPIAKALGFKTITLKDEKYVAAFIATIEEQTGREGAEAFVAFARKQLEAAAAVSVPA